MSCLLGIFCLFAVLGLCISIAYPHAFWVGLAILIAITALAALIALVAWLISKLKENQ